MPHDASPDEIFGALGWLLREGAPPPSPSLRVLAAQFVDRAKLSLKNFRVDLEAIGNAAGKAGRAGEIAMPDAQMMFLDHGEVVSRPLVRRYLEAREPELVGRWLMARPSFHFAEWASERNLAALDGMVRLGEPALAVRIVRKHLEKTQDQARKWWRLAGRKCPANVSDTVATAFEAQTAEALYRLPGEIGAARMEIAELAGYVRDHGSIEDNRAIDAMLAELEKARSRFKIA